MIYTMLDYNCYIIVLTPTNQETSKPPMWLDIMYIFQAFHLQLSALYCLMIAEDQLHPLVAMIVIKC